MVYNIERNFSATKFRQHAKSIAIEIKEVPIKAYNSVGKVKRYHTPLQQAYEIIQNKLADKQVNKEISLQMAIKAINNLARLDKIVPTLLVFRAYL